MPRHSMSFSPVSPAPQKSGQGDHAAMRPRNDKMDAMLRRATGPQYDATNVEAKLSEALARPSKVA
jgi:hypothetical protein